MKKIAFLILTALVLLPATAAYSQAWRGMARLQGTVVDAQKRPIEGAKVALRSTRADNTGPDVTTDARGKWAALGLAGGTWNIDIEAEGYLPRQISVNVSEVRRIPAIEVVLDPVPPPRQETPAQEKVLVGGTEVSPEIADAIEAGNELMQAEKYKEAIVEYEKAQTALPTNIQIKQALARAYYASGEKAPAIALLKDLNQTDPTNTTVAVLLASLLIETDELEAGRQVLAGLPENSLSDPAAWINVGILYLNKNSAKDAHEAFDRAVNLADDSPAGYYYRGLAAIQLQRLDEARADLEKAIALDPEAPESAEARELLGVMP